MELLLQAFLGLVRRQSPAHSVATVRWWAEHRDFAVVQVVEPTLGQAVELFAGGGWAIAPASAPGRQLVTHERHRPSVQVGQGVGALPLDRRAQAQEAVDR
ncbi:hypothetical protein GCM10009687_12750 [Asanoa iriomotensis]